MELASPVAPAFQADSVPLDEKKLPSDRRTGGMRRLRTESWRASVFEEVQELAELRFKARLKVKSVCELVCVYVSWRWGWVLRIGAGSSTQFVSGNKKTKC